MNALYLRLPMGCPKLVAEFGHAILDEDMRFALHQPERDHLTGAPLVHVFIVDPRTITDFRRSSSGNPREMLRAIAKVFWAVVQDKRLLRPIAGLSHREVEALTFSARGFSVEESAEQMKVSRRFGTNARRRLQEARRAHNAGGHLPGHGLPRVSLMARGDGDASPHFILALAIGLTLRITSSV